MVRAKTKTANLIILSAGKKDKAMLFVPYMRYQIGCCGDEEICGIPQCFTRYNML